MSFFAGTYIIYLCCEFILSGILKLSSFTSFLNNTFIIFKRKIPKSILLFLLSIFIFIELFTGGYPFYSGHFSPLIISTILLLYIINTIVIIISKYIFKVNTFCGCKGDYFKEPIDLKKIAKNSTHIFLLSLILWVCSGNILIYHYVLGLVLFLFSISYSHHTHKNIRRF